MDCKDALGLVNLTYSSIQSVYTLMKIFILELFFYYFFLLYPVMGFGYTYNRNGNNVFHGSKMPNLISIITCQDSLESVPWLGLYMTFMLLLPNPGLGTFDGRIS